MIPAGNMVTLHDLTLLGLVMRHHEEALGPGMTRFLARNESFLKGSIYIKLYLVLNPLSMLTIWSGETQSKPFTFQIKRTLQYQM